MQRKISHKHLFTFLQDLFLRYISASISHLVKGQGVFSMKIRHVKSLALIAVLCLTASGAFRAARSQSLGNFDKDRGRAMLSMIKDDLKKNYYDPGFRGINLDARFKETDEKIKQATSNSQIFGYIAQFLLDLDDSHTFFLPPQRRVRVDYGWRMQMIGDKCYVIAVKPGSDAEAKGLKVGDEIYSIDGFEPLRKNLWKMQYLYYTLKPKPGMRLVVIAPDGKERQLDVLAKVTEGKQVLDLTDEDGGDLWNLIRESENEQQLNRHRYYELGDDLIIWKMPEFDLSESGVDDMMSKVKKRKALILDLRGNPGGYEITLLRLLGHFFEQDVKLGTIERRKEKKPLVAKTRGDRVFKGKLVVLIDSRSGSSAEMFARTIQLEKRGTVIGDTSAGAVMRARHHQHQLGMDTVIFYGASITDSDVVMSDGKSIEHVGVTPDELLLPKATDMAAAHDPVITRAAELVGFAIDPAKAGSLFPIEWNK
jgi:C-terminal processing protease CtpA/Prc